MKSQNHFKGRDRGAATAEGGVDIDPSSLENHLGLLAQQRAA